MPGKGAHSGLLNIPYDCTTAEFNLSVGSALEIQADYLREFGQGHQVNPASRELVHTLFRRAEPVSFNSASHSITNGTETVGNPGPNSIEPAVDPTADLGVAFCVWPICPTSRSITSADMK